MSGNVQDGNDLFCTIPSPATGEAIAFTYWDLWMALVLLERFGGDWEAMKYYFHGQALYYSTDMAEGLLNHLRHLQQTLAEAGLSPEQIPGQVEAKRLNQQKGKARRKIFQLELGRDEKSYWMVHTPRRQLEFRALRGFWDLFPVSPASCADQITRLYKTKGYYSESQSFDLETKLSSFLNRHKATLAFPDQFALYRAFLTVILEKMDIVDDSGGIIGGFYKRLFVEYTRLDHAALAMPTETFFDDLLNLLIWENHGFTHRLLPEFFTSLHPNDVPIVESILQREWQELSQLGLNYQPEQALTLLGLLFTQHKQFDRFVPMAQLMQARHWERITRMAEMAESQGFPDLAMKVYEACFGAGIHERFLREKYEQLKARIGSLDE